VSGKSVALSSSEPWFLLVTKVSVIDATSEGSGWVCIDFCGSLSCYSFSMVPHASGFWCALGYAKNDSGFVILLASMAWEAQL